MATTSILADGTRYTDYSPAYLKVEAKRIARSYKLRLVNYYVRVMDHRTAQLIVLLSDKTGQQTAELTLAL